MVVEMQQIILGTDTTIWWLTEPDKYFFLHERRFTNFPTVNFFLIF
jgi:hypothetical protein